MVEIARIDLKCLGTWDLGPARTGPYLPLTPLVAHFVLFPLSNRAFSKSRFVEARHLEELAANYTTRTTMGCGGSVRKAQN